MSHNFATVVSDSNTGARLYTQCTQCGGKDNEQAVLNNRCPRAPTQQHMQQGKIYLILFIFVPHSKFCIIYLLW